MRYGYFFWLLIYFIGSNINNEIASKPKVKGGLLLIQLILLYGMLAAFLWKVMSEKSPENQPRA